MFKSSIAVLAMSGAVALGASTASASTVSMEGTSSGSFTSVAGYEYTAPRNTTRRGGGSRGSRYSTSTTAGQTSGPIAYNSTHSQVAWGSSDKSTIEIENFAISEDIDYGTTEVVLAEIEWYNAAWYNYDPYFSLEATLDVTMEGDSSPVISETVGFGITTTDNARNPNADEATLTGFDSLVTDPIDLGDGMYLTGVSLGVTGDGYLDGIDTWVTEEGGTSTLQIIGSITREMPAVPLPAAGWMLIAGLGGMMALKRRKAAT